MSPCLQKFVASKDFQKGNQKRGKGLGLRDAIETHLSDNDSYLLRCAEGLFDQMEIIQKVIEAIDEGTEVCRISFAGTFLDSEWSNEKFHGHHTMADLFRALQSLLVSEGVSCYAISNESFRIEGDRIGRYATLVIYDFLPQ